MNVEAIVNFINRNNVALLQNSTSTEKPRWLVIAPVVFLFLWSAGYAVAKLGLVYSEPMTLLALRYFFVVAIMGALFLWIRPPLPNTPAEWGHLAMVGFLIQAVYFAMCYLAFNSGIAAGTMALLMSFQPILVGLTAPRWVGETIGWQKWLGLLLGLVGAVIVIVARSDIQTPTLMGLTFAFLGLLGITGGSLWEKGFGISHHPVTANLIGYAAGLVGVLPFMFALETMQVDWTWQFVAALSYLVIGNSVIAVGLLLAMIRAGSVASVSSLFFLVPPLAALIAWLMLGEIMPVVAWFGMAVAGFGVLLATRN